MQAAHGALYLTRTLRQIESRFAQVAPPLMARAGLAAAQLARQLLQAQVASDLTITNTTKATILVCIGLGNNGGDARLAAQHLRDWGYDVHCWQAGAGSNQALPETKPQVPGPSWALALIIDGLFGIGLQRPIDGELAACIQRINEAGEAGVPVLALDIPSGLMADTGEIPKGRGGATGICVKATHTLSFIAHKPGLFMLQGPDHVGQLHLADLGLSRTALQDFAADVHLVHPDQWRDQWRPRGHLFHKGMAGSVAVIGGSKGMVGAALLAARASLLLGAGRTYIGFVQNNDEPLCLPVDPRYPELMLRHASDLLPAFPMDDAASPLAIDTWVVGPGLGKSALARALVAQTLRMAPRCVLDADALNLIAEDAQLQQLCTERAHHEQVTFITPHPAEAARLLACSVQAVQHDRLLSARRLAQRLRAHTLLKGNGTVLAMPASGEPEMLFINSTGNAGMASGGMGDVLSGVLGALLAQGLAPDAALLLGVHAHATAADALVAQGQGPVGLTASEVLSAARAVINQKT